MTTEATIRPAAAVASAPAGKASVRESSRLLRGLNLGTLLNLPSWSKAPRGTPAEIACAIREAGYEAVQGGDLSPYVAAGLTVYGAAAIRRPHEARALLTAQQAAGAGATSLHLGTGLENDAEALRLIEATLSAANQLHHSVFVETHRATLTQDMWRTLRWIEFFPELRFNADLSHWYTGLEMPYGDFAAKLGFLAPVFERVRMIHGRIGTAGSMQVAIGEGRDAPHVGHYRQMWTACFRGFLAHAPATERIPFLPELLPAVADGPNGAIHMEYAQLGRTADGAWEESSDRWEQAQRLLAIAEDAYRRIEQAG